MQSHPSHDPLLDVGDAGAIRALIVADDPLVRDRFVARISDVAAGEASSDDDVAEAVLVNAANLVLWDLGPGDPADEDHHFEDLTVPVVALSPAGTRAGDLLSRGAAGILARDATDPALRSAMGSVLHGLTVIEPAFLDAALLDAGQRSESDSEPIEPLTPREAEVLELMAAGLSNRRIAERLGISTHTAKFHIGAILDKLDADSRTEAVVRALRRGLILL